MMDIDLDDFIQQDEPTRFVYYAFLPRHRLIKIGCTAKIFHRLSALKNMTGGVEPQLIGRSIGGFGNERIVKRKFKPFQVYGELYRLEPEILEYIETECAFDVALPSKLKASKRRAA